MNRSLGYVLVSVLLASCRCGKEVAPELDPEMKAVIRPKGVGPPPAPRADGKDHLPFGLTEEPTVPTSTSVVIGPASPGHQTIADVFSGKPPVIPPSPKAPDYPDLSRPSGK